MSKLSAKIAVPVAVLTIAGGLAFAANASPVSARMSEDGHTTLMQRLVAKFNLNEAEVKAVFEEVHAEHEAKKLSAFEAKLNEAVATGRLTEAQKQLILAKHAELQALHKSMMETWSTLSEEEKKVQRDARHAEIKAWAEENGIDPKWLLPHLGGRPPMHPGMEMGDKQDVLRERPAQN